MRLSLAAWLLLLASALVAAGLPVFVRIVPNETLGVRRRSGVATGRSLAPGFHFSLPWFYDIRIVKRHIHLSSVPLADGTSTASLGWRVVDAPRFHALVETLDESLETLAGEAALQPVLEAAWRARPKPRFPVDEAAGNALRTELNQYLTPRHGLQILTLQVQSVR
jgi:hypothetical protein